MARKPIRGPRANQTATATIAHGPVDFDMSGRTPEVVPADSYDVRVLGARPVHSKSGAVSVELTLETLPDGIVADVDTLLVNSLGGESNYVRRNRGMLKDLADLGEAVSFQDVLERLNRGDIRAEVTLTVGTGLGDRTVNKLDSVDAILTDDEE